jgi:hypothetical protein
MSSTDGARHDHVGDLVSNFLENLVVRENMDAGDQVEKNNIITKTPHKAKPNYVQVLGTYVTE